jgi:hypothetical protein
MFELAAVVIASLSVVIFLAHVSKPFEPNRGSIGIMAYDIIFQSRRDRDRLFGEEVNQPLLNDDRPILCIALWLPRTITGRLGRLSQCSMVSSAPSIKKLWSF